MHFSKPAMADLFWEDIPFQISPATKLKMTEAGADYWTVNWPVMAT
jgi:hypothetical protein